MIDHKAFSVSKMKTIASQKVINSIGYYMLKPSHIQNVNSTLNLIICENTKSKVDFLSIVISANSLNIIVQNFI